MHAARCPVASSQRPAAGARIAPSSSRAVARIGAGSITTKRAVLARAAAAATTGTAPRPDSEPAALATFEAAGPPTRDRCLSVLREAARTRATPPEQVEGALSLLERLSASGADAAGSAAAAAPSPPGEAAVLGATWWLVFSTASSMRAFQYIPVRELFRVARDRVALDSRVGPVRFVISGPTVGAGAATSSSSPYDPKTGALSFSFTQVAAYWSPFSGDAEIHPDSGQAPFWSTQIKAPKQKSYTFFFAEQTEGGVGAARSSGGGLALLTRVV